MELEFRPDFEQVRQSWDAFWQGHHTHRPVVSIIIPKSGTTPVEPPVYMAGAEGDYEAAVAQVLEYGRTHEFLGEAMPYYSVEFAADHFTLLLGHAQRLSNPDSGQTAWVEPYVDDWDQADIRFDPQCHWWRRTVEYSQALRAACDGKMLIGAPTLVAGLDALVAMRGTERLMLDLVEQPDAVQRALTRLKTAYLEILDALDDLLDYKRLGSVTRHGLYSRGRILCNQCDCSCMIGPAMFEEFAAGWLEWEMDQVDAIEYHLDGPGALVHVPRLCKMSRLDVVQWVSGAGYGEQQDWMPLHRQIDQLGKGQYFGEDPEGVKRLWRELKSNKLCFRTRLQTRQEAQQLLAELETIR
jgi:hypothetical protein